MKRGLILIGLVILLLSFVSSEITFDQPLNSVYNVEDNIFLPVTLKSSSEISAIFKIDILCGENSINFFNWNGIKLSAGEERILNLSIYLNKNLIGENSGVCKIKASLNSEMVFSPEFKISKLLLIDAAPEQNEIDAGQDVVIKGTITKENGQNLNGIAEAEIITIANESIRQSVNVIDGNMEITLSLPKELKAGAYEIKIRAFEKDSEGKIVNSGESSSQLIVKQVPTSLEIIFETKEVTPGTPANVKAILHDQTGDPISTTAFITIKDTEGQILDQKEMNTNEFMQYMTQPQESPKTLNVFATSNQLTAEDKFNIKIKESIEVVILNKTISITNNGNVDYNKTLIIKVADTPINLSLNLKVGENKRYILTAPKGQYNVEIIPDGEEGKVSEIMSLTGKAIGIRESSEGGYSLLWVWILIILILIAGALIFFGKLYKKPFFGRRMFFKKENQNNRPTSLKGIKELTPAKIGNKAELSLSIKGEKQEAGIICLKIDNLRSVMSGKGSASDTIQKMIDRAEENKAATYENQNYLFFIFAPMKTKNLKNERIALNIAEKIQEMLTNHNRTFNEKINFGLALETGTIVAQIEGNAFKFMSMGTLITSAKKIASLSKGDILLSPKINDLLRLDIKSDKETRDGTAVYIITKIKKENEETKQFIDKFMHRQGK